MPTPFETALRQAESVLDAVMGEEFRLTPRKTPAGDVNAAPAADASRAVLTFTAIFCEASADSEPAPRRGTAGGVWRGTEPAIDIRAGVFDGHGGIRRDDVIERIATGDRFRADAPLRGDLGRMFVPLTRIKA